MLDEFNEAELALVRCFFVAGEGEVSSIVSRLQVRAWGVGGDDKTVSSQSLTEESDGGLG